MAANEAAPWLVRAGMVNALQEGHRQVGEGAEKSDQDGVGSGEYSYEDQLKGFENLDPDRFFRWLEMVY